MIFDLSCPPSANRLWRRSGHIIHKSAEYKSWLTAAGYEIASQRKGAPRIDGPAAIDIRIGRMHALRDRDSVIKPLNDLMQHMGVVANDNLIVRGTYGDDESVPKGRIHITIIPISRSAVPREAQGRGRVAARVPALSTQTEGNTCGTVAPGES